MYFTALSKNINTNLASVGISIAVTLNNIAIFIGPCITGAIMGEKATKATIQECCWLFAIFAGFGLLASIWLIWTDRLWNEQNLIRIEDEKYGFPDQVNSILIANKNILDEKVLGLDRAPNERYSLDIGKVDLGSAQGPGDDGSPERIGKYELDVQEDDGLGVRNPQSEKNSDEKYIIHR